MLTYLGITRASRRSRKSCPLIALIEADVSRRSEQKQLSTVSSSRTVQIENFECKINFLSPPKGQLTTQGSSCQLPFRLFSIRCMQHTLRVRHLNSYQSIVISSRFVRQNLHTTLEQKILFSFVLCHVGMGEPTILILMNRRTCYFNGEPSRTASYRKCMRQLSEQG